MQNATKSNRSTFLCHVFYVDMYGFCQLIPTNMVLCHRGNNNVACTHVWHVRNKINNWICTANRRFGKYIDKLYIFALEISHASNNCVRSKWIDDARNHCRTAYTILLFVNNKLHLNELCDFYDDNKIVFKALAHSLSFISPQFAYIDLCIYLAIHWIY